MARIILGISALYHDAAAALLVDGQLVAAAQEERFSRVKHDPSLPLRAATWCLTEAGLTIHDVDYLVFYEKPLRKFERILTTQVATFPRSWRSFGRAMRTWLGDKLWLRNTLVTSFGIAPDRILFSEHHLSHAASAFLCSPHEEAAILTVDGVGEAATTALWRGTAQAPFIEPLGEVRYPHSIGLLYSAVTAYLGFAINEGEYKVMGMAGYGQPRFRTEMDRLLRLDSDGGFSLDLDYFSFHYDPRHSYRPRLESLLGPARFPGAPFLPEHIAEQCNERVDEAVVAESQRHADVAASLQAAVEDAMLHLARHAHAQTGAKALCLAGGVGLNSVANHRLARDGPFEQLWVQPAAGDAGGALGAALWAWHSVLGHPRSITLDRIDLGRSWTRSEVGDYLRDLGQTHEDIGWDRAVERAAEDLEAGQIIGWYDGRFEWGPRALGHRSILADPRIANHRDAVNERVKFREPFRPFAPAFTAEAIDTYLDLPEAARHLSRYMLVAAPVRSDKRDLLPATTHIDGTARGQRVEAADHPHFHALIARFGEATGVPAVLNTSFNRKGDTIASSPVDAVATHIRCALDCLYIEGFRVEKKR